MKFSMKLERSIVSEWKDAYLSYQQLKEYIKEIEKLQEMPTIDKKLNGFLNFFLGVEQRQVQHLKRRLADGFFSLLNKQNQGVRQQNGDHRVRMISEQIKKKAMENFFEKLDEELQKVSNFYEMKVIEFIERSDKLSRQLTLLDLKEPHLMDDFSRPPSPSDSPVAVADAASHVIYESSHASDDDEIREVGSEHASVGSTRDNVGTPNRADPVMISSIQDCMGLDKDLIKEGFEELHKDLGFLMTYRSLNMEGFAKIIEKFDNVCKFMEPSTKPDSKKFLTRVDYSYLGTSDKLVKLVDEVEDILSKNFNLTVKLLKISPPEDSHLVSQCTGSFIGCTIYGLVIYAMLGHLSGVFYRPEYIHTIGPFFRAFACISLAMYIYGWDLYLWSKTGVNHYFILEIKYPKKAYNYQNAWCSSTFLIFITVSILLIHLVFFMTNDTMHGLLNRYLGAIVLLYVTSLLCPLDVFHRSTRWCFLRVFWKIVFSPFYKVHPMQFLMAGQLISMISMFKDIEFIACYFFGRGHTRHSYEACSFTEVHKFYFYIIAYFPYVSQIIQGVRRYRIDNDNTHLLNAGKNLSALAAMGFHIMYAEHPTHMWFGIVLITSTFATIYQLYWDFVEDWGLLNLKSNNKWLRDELILKNKNFYYISIVINFLLRLTWIYTLLNLKRLSDFNHHLIELLLALLEIIRRGIWHFYRMENEYLNNVGKFRPVKTVPIPY